MDWSGAIARAELLAAKLKAAAPLLEYARAVFRVQQEIYRKASTSPSKDPQTLDMAMLVPFLSDFLHLVEHKGPADLAEQARRFQERADWEGILRTCWQRKSDRLDLLARTILQPYVQYRSERWRVEVGLLEDETPACPFCGRGPLLSLDGGRRMLHCALCANEWAYPSGRCPGCHGSKIRLQRSRALPHVRLEACEGCGHYLKGVDLRREPQAVGPVDEMAAADLDRFAKDEGYTKFEPNLAGH